MARSDNDTPDYHISDDLSTPTSPFPPALEDQVVDFLPGSCYIYEAMSEQRTFQRSLHLSYDIRSKSSNHWERTRDGHSIMVP